MWKTKDLLSLLISLRKNTSIPWYQVQTGAHPCWVLYLFCSHSGRALLAFPSGYEAEIIQRGKFSLWTRSWNLWPARDVIKADPESLKTGGWQNKGWETSKLYKKNCFWHSIFFRRLEITEPLKSYKAYLIPQGEYVERVLPPPP